MRYFLSKPKIYLGTSCQLRKKVSDVLTFLIKLNTLKAVSHNKDHRRIFLSHCTANFDAKLHLDTSKNQSYIAKTPIGFSQILDNFLTIVKVGN